MPLDIIMFTGRSKATEPSLRIRLHMAILGICLRVDGCTNLRGKLGTKLGHGALNLAQESSKLILLLWFALIVGVGVSMLPG